MTDPRGKSDRGYDVDHKLVSDFANHMFTKMRQNRHKAHWSTVTNSWLLERLKEEVQELEDAMRGNSDNVPMEAADVANFAAMIADNYKVTK